ncbi:MAG: Serine-tRNA ligase [Candidatus Jorgensenbacteria bacterium GW2011_GWB1_49_9]|nr:MAG: Serine-tRNA ligase [Candidatus Jorgensenbacteria bacterium GW2011_GWB1_49_9]
MLDINLIRKNPEAVKAGIEKKNGDPKLVDKLLRVDEDWRAKAAALDHLQSEQNGLSKELSKRRTKDSLARAGLLKKRIAEMVVENEILDGKRLEILGRLPNLPLPGVPFGKDESANKILREVGEKTKFDFKPKDHLQLGEYLDIIDFGTGSKVVGSGFYYLKNDGVLLELALVRYALDFLAKQGFVLWFTPDLARDKFYLGTGYAPRGPEAQTYAIQGSDLGLIATAEVTLAGIHADEILSEADLPKLYAGYSHCFRQESGGYGKYSKGLYRVHQFTKVEMFAYARPEDSPEIHEKLLKLEEEMWAGLGIPYRVVEMCTGDLGAQAARKIDLEAWMPGRGDWGEVTSTSNTTDYQARRLNIKFKNKDGKAGFAHTLNGTAIATSRAIIAILENYQTKKGTVMVPEALRGYVGKKEIGK